MLLTVSSEVDRAHSRWVENFLSSKVLVENIWMVQSPSLEGVTDICWQGSSAFCVKDIGSSCPTVSLKSACFGISLSPITYTKHNNTTSITWNWTLIACIHVGMLWFKHNKRKLQTEGNSTMCASAWSICSSGWIKSVIGTCCSKVQIGNGCNTSWWHFVSAIDANSVCDIAQFNLR